MILLLFCKCTAEELNFSFYSEKQQHSYISAHYRNCSEVAFYVGFLRHFTFIYFCIYSLIPLCLRDLKRTLPVLRRRKKTMIHFCCLFASQQMASPKPWMKNLMYHIFHIFFILQTIMLQVTFLHTDNKKKIT